MIAILSALSVVLLISVFHTLPWVLRSSVQYRDYSEPVILARDGFYHYENGIDLLDSGTFDPMGIRQAVYPPPLGNQYNPVTIAQFVLSLVPYQDEERSRTAVINNLGFLLDNSHSTPHGNILYPYLFDWEINDEAAVWYSAMAQGQVASAMLWGHRITGDDKYRDAALRSVLALDELAGELSVPLASGIWLKEYPEYEFSVLDGNLAAIAGVYDVFRSIPGSDENAMVLRSLLDDALAGFKSNWQCFKPQAGGIYYSDRREIASVGYYQASLGWLEYLSAYDSELANIREQFLSPRVSKTESVWTLFRNAFYERVLDPLNMLSPCIN